MILPNSDLNKQAREKMMEQCSDLLVISLRATAKHLRIAYSNLESDADNIIKGVDRIESLSAQVAELKKDAEPMYQPKPDRRIGAFTPTIYPGHLESRPPPFINIYESHNASPSVIVTVRGVANKDGSQGPVSCMEILEPEFREFITYCARWLGWLPITEEQWLRYYEINKPDAAKESGP